MHDNGDDGDTIWARASLSETFGVCMCAARARRKRGREGRGSTEERTVHGQARWRVMEHAAWGDDTALGLPCPRAAYRKRCFGGCCAAACQIRAPQRPQHAAGCIAHDRAKETQATPRLVCGKAVHWCCYPGHAPPAQLVVATHARQSGPPAPNECVSRARHPVHPSRLLHSSTYRVDQVAQSSHGGEGGVVGGWGGGWCPVFDEGEGWKNEVGKSQVECGGDGRHAMRCAAR